MSMPKTPEQLAREAIDRRLNDAGWIIQDMNRINLSAALGVAIREFPTSTGQRKIQKVKTLLLLKASLPDMLTAPSSILTMAMRFGLPMRLLVP